MNSKKFVHFDSSGNPWGVVNVFQLWADVYGLAYSRPENRIEKKIWDNLYDQAKAVAAEMEEWSCKLN